MCHNAVSYVQSHFYVDVYVYVSNVIQFAFLFRLLMSWNCQSISVIILQLGMLQSQ